MRKTMSPSSAEIRSLVNTALGNEKADLAIVNGDLVNVYTGELLNGWSVAIKGKWIAYVGSDAGHAIGPETEVIDASGKTLIPGLIDGHAHLAWYYTVPEFLKYAMTGGTTTIITETLEVCFPLGYQGILELLESIKDQPIKIFATAPGIFPASTASESRDLDMEALRTLLHREEIVGLGESYWVTLLQGDKTIHDLFAEALAAGKTLEGHAAGARGNKLVAYLSAGVSSCHESTTVEEALERLRLGIHTMIREGDIRTELPVVSKIKDAGINFRRLTLVTDGVGPEQLVKDGYLELVVQRAIDFGFDPIAAIQMATINAAEHFSLDNLIGGIAPGKYADIAIIPNLQTIRAEYVISNGRIIARNGEAIVPPRKAPSTTGSFQVAQITRKLNPSDFVIRAQTETGPGKVRVIDLVTGLVAREVELDVVAEKGEIKADINRDILKIAVITTNNQVEKIFTGLVKGFGIRKGAVASSAAWEACAIIVLGTNEQDMAEAVNRIIALKGGVVVCVDGQIKAELPLPVGGIISDQPVEFIAQRLADIQQKMTGLGCPFPNAHLTLTVLTTRGIPFLRISEEGLVDVRKGEIVDLVIAHPTASSGTDGASGNSLSE